MSKALILKLRADRDAARASAETLLTKMEAGDLTETEQSNLKSLTDEATTLDARIKELTEMETQRIEAENLDARFDRLREEKSSTLQVTEPAPDLGSRFTESEAYKSYLKTPSGNSGVFSTEMALVTTIDVNDANLIGTQRVRDAAMPTVSTPFLDALGYEPVGGNALDWIEWPLVVPEAGVVAEGAVKPEATYAPVLRSGTLEKLAHHIPVTREMLEDMPRARAIISGALMTGVRLKAEDNAYTALKAATLPTAQTSLADGGTLLGAIRIGIAECRAHGWASGTVVLNPFDYADIDISLLESTLLGARRDSSVWGLTVVSSAIVDPGTAYVGDFKAGMTLFDRRVTNLYITDSHASEFTSNILRILAEARMKAIVTRPEAIVECSVGA
jgi:hypothetical protein